ncbi:hypothetical protein JTY60_00380 [symbiont of Argiope bruennichi]|uniref:hypothetical protein n=1 Tax=symbiont of Argiope bruennichi TaxID=2810479 RepID=UPI003DA2B28D
MNVNLIEKIKIGLLGLICLFLMIGCIGIFKAGNKISHQGEVYHCYYKKNTQKLVCGWFDPNDLPDM